MLLKSADDKSKRIALLEDLQRSPVIDAGQKKWLREELGRLKKGIQGERESTHYLDSYFKDSENHVVLHDLRLVVDGDVAQIDHLIMNRASHFFLIETKNYSGNVVINEMGEFTAVYEEDRFGIPSPIEQSHRHERILSKLLEKLEITGRTEKLPTFHHVVMFHPKAVIERPPKKDVDTSNVIKSDQFPTWHQQFANKLGVGDILKAAFNMRSPETIREWAEQLVRQHRPADLLALPEFLKPKAGVANEHLSAQAQAPQAEEPAKRLICVQCGTKISYAEGKFCWNNAKRFGGQQYCREHQSQL